AHRLKMSSAFSSLISMISDVKPATEARSSPLPLRVEPIFSDPAPLTSVSPMLQDLLLRSRLILCRFQQLPVLQLGPRASFSASLADLQTQFHPVSEALPPRTVR